ncbi:MAG: carboxypeptidase regulatory-like domain-containing protein [Deltaproteobacteria bacterium]|nr:carboxypeptidase regulatory-like domain-containing protein [Deltaproteobacteria bacterium]
MGTRCVHWVLAAVFCAGSLGCGGSARSRGAATARPRGRVVASLAAVPLADCPTAPGSSGSAGIEADPRVRAAAQKGLEFLARDTIAWQEQHNCYGCHVQAVTLEAQIVGRRHDYRVPAEDLQAVMRGMLEIPGGARRPVGFSVQDNPSHLIESAKAFGGAALAQYDEHMGPEVREELIRTAESLLEYQEADGSVRSTDRRPPVVAGPMQSTTQAAQTWRQAYARTANERWLPPIARAEAYLRNRAAQLTDDAPERILELDYAIIGLVAAGAQATEAVLRDLDRQLRGGQNDDGGWAMGRGGDSDAFSTGQALYALKLLGANDGDSAIRRGAAWLVDHQREDGGWSQGGARRGEAMWAVLGLVSTDVMSLSIAGLRDGEHVSGPTEIALGASDNGGAAVRRLDVSVDDVPVHSVCGDRARYSLDASTLAEGVHQVDVVATNTRGQTSRRRIEVYAGDYYLTRVGTTFADGSTIVSFRNVAPAATPTAVRLRVLTDTGRPGEGEEVFSTRQEGTQGAMRFSWNGATRDGGRAAAGRYRATLEIESAGRTLQTVDVPFVHDTLEAQRAAFGEVAGQLRVDGAAPAANAEVELVDQSGNVLQRARTTHSGQYRFRNLERGRYSVRVRRPGFRDATAPVTAAPASTDSADFDLARH